MHLPYEDITSRIAEAPSWWDRGVPRYGKFEPWQISRYANQTALIRIACQHCWDEFLIGEARGLPGKPLFGEDGRTVVAAVDDPPFHGDPNEAGCTGCTMTVVELEIVEAWERVDHRWHRRPELEHVINYD